MKKHTVVSTENMFEIFSSSQNVLIWKSWIDDFEDRMNRGDGIGSNISESPIYAAWLMMSGEHIFQRIRQHLFVDSGLVQDTVFDLGYDKLMAEVAKSIPRLDPQAIKSVLICRHIMAHKGFPFLQHVPMAKEKKSHLPKEVCQEAAFIANPMQYKEIKRRFDSVNNCLDQALHKRSFSDKENTDGN